MSKKQKVHYISGAWCKRLMTESRQVETTEKSPDEQAAAWRAVFDELLRYNPDFAKGPYCGQESALREIRRLQALDRSAEEPEACPVHTQPGHPFADCTCIAEKATERHEHPLDEWLQPVRASEYRTTTFKSKNQAGNLPCDHCGWGVAQHEASTLACPIKPYTEKCEHGIPRQFCTAVHAENGYGER